jgi:hypothetical protein
MTLRAYFGRLFRLWEARFREPFADFQAKHDRPFALHATRYRSRAERGADETFTCPDHHRDAPADHQITRTCPPTRFPP